MLEKNSCVKCVLLFILLIAFLIQSSVLYDQSTGNYAQGSTTLNYVKLCSNCKYQDISCKALRDLGLYGSLISFIFSLHWYATLHFISHPVLLHILPGWLRCPSWPPAASAKTNTQIIINFAAQYVSVVHQENPIINQNIWENYHPSHQGRCKERVWSGLGDNSNKSILCSDL